MSVRVLWSDGGEPDHHACLVTDGHHVRLRIARRDADGRRVSYYVDLSPEQRVELARALVNAEADA